MAQQQQSGVRLPPHLQPRPKAVATSSSSASSPLKGVRGSSPTPPKDGPVKHASSGSLLRTQSSPSLDASRNSSTLLDPVRADTSPLDPKRATSRARSRSPNPSTAGPRSRSANTASAASPRVSTASDEATEVLIRRVLCPYSQGGLHGSQALDELLPPLTSSNAVDLQLYAILAIVIKEFVTSWYAKITPDQTFIEEVVRIIAHCTRDLEQRLRRLDLTALVLDEIPALVQNHVTAFRAATDAQCSPSLATNPRAIYHALHPHPAFSPVPQLNDPVSEEAQAANESHYRQLLIHGTLAVLLPTEDLRSPPLRILVADILGEMILGRGLGEKACEGWLIWDGINKIVVSVLQRVEPKATGAEMEVGTRSRLERFGLLAEQSDTERSQQPRQRRSSASEWGWRLLQYAYLTYLGLHFLVTGIFAAATGPASLRATWWSKAASAADAAPTHGPSNAVSDRGRSPITAGMEAPGAGSGPPRPILSLAIWDLVSGLLDLQGRAPWTLGALALARWHLTEPTGWLLGLGALDGTIDKFLVTLIDRHVLIPARLPPALLQLRLALFPHNSLGPARATPTAYEQLEIRRRTAASILDLVPGPVARRLFNGHLAEPSRTGEGSFMASVHAPVHRSPALLRTESPSSQTSRQSSRGPDATRPATTATSPLAASMTMDDIDAENERLHNEPHGNESEGCDPTEEVMLRDIEGMLDVFGDVYMNKHLIFGIVELLFVRLMPELAEKGVQELLEERGVAV